MNIYEFALSISSAEPLTWPDSYELYGKRAGTYTNYADNIPIGTYHDDYWYADCKLCEHSTKIRPTHAEAIEDHFLHCAREHGYVYPADKVLKVADRELQNLIQLAKEYDLPVPHLECTENCIRQYRNVGNDVIIVCGIHEGNEHKGTVWSTSIL
jgi:hypothetical protein